MHLCVQKKLFVVPQAVDLLATLGFILTANYKDCMKEQGTGAVNEFPTPLATYPLSPAPPSLPRLSLDLETVLELHMVMFEPDPSAGGTGPWVTWFDGLSSNIEIIDECLAMPWDP